MTQSGHRVGPTCGSLPRCFGRGAGCSPHRQARVRLLSSRFPALQILPVFAVTAALWEHHRRACNLRKFQLHVRSFVGGFGRRTAPNNLNLSVGDRRLISEAHPRKPFEEVRGSELHLDFKSAHRVTLKAIPHPGPVYRSRHYCRYQKWSKGQGRSTRCHYRPEPNECSSALDSPWRRDRFGTEGWPRGPSRETQEVGSSYAPSLNHRIDRERATAEWMQRGRFAAARRQFVIFCYDRWRTSGKALEATRWAASLKARRPCWRDCHCTPQSSRVQDYPVERIEPPRRRSGYRKSTHWTPIRSAVALPGSAAKADMQTALTNVCCWG
jgi:hypothetical protein